MKELLRSEDLSFAEVRVPPGTQTALHALDVHETQYVVSGKGTVQLGEDRIEEVGPGDLISISVDTAQRIRNHGSEPLIITCVCTPPFTEEGYQHLADAEVFDFSETASPRPGVVAVVAAFGNENLPSHRGKVAVVTGGNGGLGQELCHRLGQLGFTVVLTGRDETQGHEAAARLQSRGLDVRFERLDVTSASNAASLAKKLSSTFNGLDVLIHCAGANLDAGASPAMEDNILNVSDERLLRSLEINALGPLRVSRELIPLLKNRKGRIINVSSDLASIESMGKDFPSYRLAKATLNAQTVALADALKEDGVSVNCVSPGWVKTRMGGPHAPSEPLEGVQAMLWLSTCEKVPTGGFFRRVTDVPPPPGMVEIERVPW